MKKVINFFNWLPLMATMIVIAYMMVKSPSVNLGYVVGPIAVLFVAYLTRASHFYMNREDKLDIVASILTLSWVSSVCVLIAGYIINNAADGIFSPILETTIFVFFGTALVIMVIYLREKIKRPMDL